MPRPDVSDERRPQILAAALKVFTHHGFDAARMEQIATESGLSIGGLYWYYKSKDAIILGLLDSIINTDLADLRARLAHPGSVYDRLAAYLAESTAAALEIAPVTYEIYSLALRNPAVRQQVGGYFHRYRDALAEFIQQGIAIGEIRPLDPYAAANALAALYEGTLELALFDPHTVDPIATLHTQLNLLWNGLRNHANP